MNNLALLLQDIFNILIAIAVLLLYLAVIDIRKKVEEKGGETNGKE